MDLNQLPIFSLISKKMSYLNRKQESIAQNLANSDTPGYRAQMVDEPDFSSYLSGSGTTTSGSKIKMATTSPEHIKGGAVLRLGGVSSREAAIHGKEQFSPDGNSVDISEQVMDLADTQLQYNMATNIYRKQVQLLKTALGRTGS